MENLDKLNFLKDLLESVKYSFNHKRKTKLFKQRRLEAHKKELNLFMKNKNVAVKKEGDKVKKIINSYLKQLKPKKKNKIKKLSKPKIQKCKHGQTGPNDHCICWESRAYGADD